MTEWEPPLEEETNTPSSEAITTPVTRTVVDESENFFSAFLSAGDAQSIDKTQVVSVPPSKSHRRLQEEESINQEAVVISDLKEAQTSGPADEEENHEVALSPLVELEVSPVSSHPDTLITTEAPDTGHSEHSSSPDSSVDIQGCAEESDNTAFCVEPNAEQCQASSEEQDTTDSMATPPVTSEPESSFSSDASPSAPSKDVLLEAKDSKLEDRQNDTPSPPVSAFSSGTSTTSDIEVLDHESVLSESSASSRQETGESKAGLHLMQGSFQLLTASTCGDFPRLEDYQKLTESCGSSSDAFERIDSFSVQSLDSRSVSEVNSDDEIPGSRTLASVTAGPAPIPVVSPAECQGEEEEVEEKAGAEEEEEEGFAETMREQSLDEMEESGRSATPVNSDQLEELTEHEQGFGADLTLSDSTANDEEQHIPPITEEMKSVSTVQILELQKVALSTNNTQSLE